MGVTAVPINATGYTQYYCITGISHAESLPPIVLKDGFHSSKSATVARYSLATSTQS